MNSHPITFRRAALWLGVAVLACYLWSVTGTFHFDDSHSVESNIAIRSMRNIPSFWLDPRTSSFIPENRVYRPLVYTFYSLCWVIGQGATWPFHLMKMGMHWLVCLGVYFIWRRLWSEPGWFPVAALQMRLPNANRAFEITPARAAFLLALLFAVHPAGSECVNYVSATTSLECAMFYIGAYCAYLRNRDTDEIRWLGLSLLLYFLSVASKEEGITLPAMVALTEFFLHSGQFKTRILPAIRRVLPYGILGVLLAAWIFTMHPESGNESRGFVTWDAYFMTQWRAYLWYMRLWFWPWDLNADYASIEFAKSITDPLVIQALLGNVLLGIFAWTQRQRFPALLFGLCWFYVTISPASSVIKLAEAINEHRMYLAYVGFIGGTFTVVLFMAERFFAPEWRALRLGWIYGLVFIGLFVGTQSRNRVWADDEALWADTVAKNPTSGRALNNLALVYMARADYPKAVDYLEKCEQFWTSYMYCPLNRGIALQSLGLAAKKAGQADEAEALYGRAEAAFERAYQLNSRSVHANFQLGQFYQDIRKDCGRAIDLFRVAVEVTGGRYPTAEARIASCHTSQGHVTLALPLLAHALGVEPDNQVVLFEKARAEYESRNATAAIQTYTHLLRANPGHVQGWYNLGIVYKELNDLPAARRAFDRTVALDPANLEGLRNLALVCEGLGDGTAAIKAMQSLVSLDPTKSEYAAKLVRLKERFGG